MTPTQTSPAASPAVPVRAFSRRVVDFTEEASVAPVVAPAAPAAPLRLNAREQAIADAKAADDAAIAKAQAAAKASAERARVNEQAGNVPAYCSHAGCRTGAISRMMSWDRSGKPICGKHAGPGSVSWQGLQRRNEAEAERWLNERLRR